jgi:two-component system chemotaxis response regulator CheB
MRGPRENRHRPAIDVLFRSAARDFGDRVVGVILTGSLDDGTAGMLAIKNRGGITIVQAPENAFCPDMPKSVLRMLQPDHILPLNEIASTLEVLARTHVETPVSPLSSTTRQETLISELNMNAIQEDNRPGKPSTFACPDCHGVLWEIEDSGDLTRYRCRVGHGYSAATLADAHSEHLENCMWAALRALEESASLARKMAERSRQKERHASAARFEEHARSKERQASMMRTVLLESEKLMSDLSSATSRLNIA